MAEALTDGERNKLQAEIEAWAFTEGLNSTDGALDRPIALVDLSMTIAHKVLAYLPGSANRGHVAERIQYAGIDAYLRGLLTAAQRQRQFSIPFLHQSSTGDDLITLALDPDTDGQLVRTHLAHQYNGPYGVSPRLVLMLAIAEVEAWHTAKAAGRLTDNLPQVAETAHPLPLKQLIDQVYQSGQLTADDIKALHAATAEHKQGATTLSGSVL